MFNTMGDMFKQLHAAQRLMRDEKFRALISHPKVQAAFQDPDIRALLTAQDPAKLMAHPKLAALLRDPDVSQLFAQLDPKTLTG